jgi:ATP-dependent RNA helicase DHX33
MHLSTINGINSAKVLYVQGRQHPITIYHAKIDHSEWFDAALRTFFQIHLDGEPGDVLIFLPGKRIS